MIVSTHSSFSNRVFFDSVFILLQNIKRFLMYPCHLRLHFLVFLHLLKANAPVLHLVFREGDLNECNIYERQSDMFFLFGQM